MQCKCDLNLIFIDGSDDNDNDTKVVPERIDLTTDPSKGKYLKCNVNVIWV